MSGVAPGLVARARDWVAADPDPLTRAELEDLLDQAEGGDPAALAELVDRFSADLQFGTDGLRGALWQTLMLAGVALWMLAGMLAGMLAR